MKKNFILPKIKAATDRKASETGKKVIETGVSKAATGEKVAAKGVLETLTGDEIVATGRKVDETGV